MLAGSGGVTPDVTKTLLLSSSVEGEGGRKVVEPGNVGVERVVDGVKERLLRSSLQSVSLDATCPSPGEETRLITSSGGEEVIPLSEDFCTRSHFSLLVQWPRPLPETKSWRELK